MCALWPSRTPGTPGSDAPATWYPGADSATSYQIDGSVCGRCGSPPSSAPPPSTLGPFTAQALLSGYWWIWSAGSWPSSSSSWPAASVTAFVTVVVVAFVAPLERPGGSGPVDVAVVDVVDAAAVDAGGDSAAGALL